MLSFALLFLHSNAQTSQTVQLGDGLSSAPSTTGTPIGSASNYSYSQSLYTKARINAAGYSDEGYITKIAFLYSSGGSNKGNSSGWTVYMAHHSGLFGTVGPPYSWVPHASFTEVFSGTVTIPNTNMSWMEITLDQPFRYNNEDNLVIAVDENAPGSSGSIYWKLSNNSGNYTSFRSSSSSDINPASPHNASSSRGNEPPQVRLTFVDGFLPVKLGYFRAEAQENANVLKWQTLSEQNNASFLLEKSEDGENWTALFRQEGAGNSNIPLSYEFSDDAPAELTYYRLSQHDFDGKSETFNPVVVTRAANRASEWNVYPNPADDVVHIQGTASLTAYTLQGLRVELNYRPWDTRIDISHLAPGTYFFRTAEGKTARIVKL